MSDPEGTDPHAPPRAGGVACETWIRALLDTTLDYAVILLASDGTIDGWHGAAERIFGHGAAETLGRPVGMLFTPEDLARGLDRQEIAVTLATGRSEDDRWHLRRDGQRIWCSGIMTTLRDDATGAVRLCKIMRDRTDLRAQVEALEHRLAARAQEIERRKAFFASTVHELRNPLGPMKMSLQLLARELPPDARQRTLAILDRQVALLATLVDDLAEGVQRDSPEVLLTLHPVDLSESLRQIVEGQRPQAEASQVALQLVLPDVPIQLQADAGRLQQVLINVVGNAIKYGKAGGHVNITASIEVDMAVVRVEDDGIGIAPDVLPHIFELFTREGRDGNVKGLGVGLAVVQRLVALHGGNVEVRSAGPGKGSTFAMRLPLRPAGDAGSGKA